MRLYVTDRTDIELTFDITIMSTLEFNSIQAHPFIITSKFDAVIIDCNKKLAHNLLTELIAITRVVPVIPDEINSEFCTILCVLYREYSAKLRYAFMHSKEEFMSIVNQLAEESKWKELYV